VDLREKVVGLTRNAAAPGGFQRTETGEMYRGYGDGMARAFEFALTPAIFCGIGYAIDRWLGIVPVFSIILFLLAVAGMFARTWYAYEARMQAEDIGTPWARSAPPGSERGVSS
jgi:F0F1-type ATP synthase assembly protein I